MRMFSVPQCNRGTARDWITGLWVMQIWLPIAMLVLLHILMLTQYWMLFPARSLWYYEFWTEPIDGPVSQLTLMLSMLCGWAVLSLVEILRCCVDRTEPRRITRMVLHLGIIGLLVSYMLIVRTFALAFILWGPGKG